MANPLLPPDYRPSEDEEFMNPRQREYFRQKLYSWRAELLRESNETLRNLQSESLGLKQVVQGRLAPLIAGHLQIGGIDPGSEIA